MNHYNFRSRVNNSQRNNHLRLNARRAIPRTLISFKKPSPNDIRAADRDHLFIKKILASPPYHVTNQLTQESHWCLEAQWHGIDGIYDEPEIVHSHDAVIVNYLRLRLRKTYERRLDDEK